MSRNALKLSIAVAVVALSTLVVSTIARPGIGNPIVEQVNTTRPDFDRVFSDAASVNSRCSPMSTARRFARSA